MKYSQIFKRAFNVVRNEPALWIVGVIMAIFGGAGGGVNFNGGGNFNPGNSFDEELANQLPSELPPWFNFETLLPIGLLILCLIIGWGLFAFAIRNVALAGLIYGSERASVGQDVRWRELLRFGWSGYALRLMGLNFLLALPALLFFLLALIVGGIIAFTVFEGFAAGGPPSFESVGVLFSAFGLFFCFIMIIALLSWVLSLIGHYASRFIVLDGHSIMDGFGKGWQLLKNNVGHTFVIAILLIVLSFVLGLIVSIIFIMLALFMVVPLIALMVSESITLVVGAILAVLAIIVITILASLLYGPFLAYIQTVWTLVWLELTQHDEGEIMLDEAMI